jgi:hypothetical protein
MTLITTSTAFPDPSASLNNPLREPNVIKTLVGCILGGVVLMVIITVILCLYRDRHPFDKCGCRRKPKTIDLEILPKFNPAILRSPNRLQKPS